MDCYKASFGNRELDARASKGSSVLGFRGNQKRCVPLHRMILSDIQKMTASDPYQAEVHYTSIFCRRKEKNITFRDTLHASIIYLKEKVVENLKIPIVHACSCKKHAI
jgi:hypothetical protein